MAGNQGNNRIVWAGWQLQYLKDNFATMTAQQLSDALGIKRTKVREQYYALGLKKQEMEYWTKKQVQFLKQKYQTLGDTELAAEFAKRWHKDKGWSKKHIEKKRCYLKLKRTAEQMKAIHQRNVDAGMFAICPVKAWDVRGRVKLGERRVWFNKHGSPVVVIKLRWGFVHYAPWLYKHVFGPVPPGCVVRIKDGDTTNIIPSNLIVLTRSQNATLNSQNRHPELTQSRRIINQIRKTTKLYEKQIK